MDLRIPVTSLGSSSLKDLLQPRLLKSSSGTGVFLSSSSSFAQRTHCTARRQWRSQQRNGNRPQFSARAVSSTARDGQRQNQDLPRVLPKHKKKPFVSPPRRGGFQVKKGPKERNLRPPANGLLVQGLIPVAHEVFEARNALIKLVTKLMEVVPVKACKFCSHTHVGPIGHHLATCDGPNSGYRRSQHVWTNARLDDVFADLDTYHLYDRLKTFKHDQRFSVERIPAIVELCIQAGVTLPEYSTLRRTKRVRVIGKRIIEHDSMFDLDDVELDGLDVFSRKENGGLETEDEYRETSTLQEETSLGVCDNNDNATIEEQIKTPTDWTLADLEKEAASLSSQEIVDMAELALKAWQIMWDGTKKLMNKYPVRVCGYCPELHIGPRGHKVKLCGAFKHQWRQGQHGWQESTIEDVIPPKYVWHVRDLQAPLLVKELRRYYGQTPAVVELCVQAGAAIPDAYKAMMRLDVTIPDVHERENVV